MSSSAATPRAPKPPARRVLLVDDEPHLVEGLQRALAMEGYDVTGAVTFEAAARELRSRAFDALITDVRLGAFNGLQLAGLARDLNPDMVILVFSGFDDVVLREEAAHVGAAYLVKPVRLEQLLAALEASG
jgi:DNA-binding response OmpR family regulator